MNNGKHGRTFSPRWIAWPKSTRREGRHESELEPHRARTSRRVAPAARARDRNRRRIGAAFGSRLRRRACGWFVGSGSRGARPAELRLADAGMRIEPRGTAAGCAGLAPTTGIDRTQRRNANGIVHTRPALRRANVIEEPGLHVDSRAHAGAGHRREYGDFQRGRCDAVASVAVPGVGAVGNALVNVENASRREIQRLYAGLPRVAGAESGL